MCYVFEIELIYRLKFEKNKFVWALFLVGALGLGLTWLDVCGYVCVYIYL